MKSRWLNKQSKNSLILFFNGWGMDENPFSHLKTDFHDVLMFYDYRNIDIKNFPIKEISEYSDIKIIGWSMGVYFANFFSQYITNPSISIALNGTLKPIDDLYGIPKAVYKLTTEQMSESVKHNFFVKMFKNKDSIEKFTLNQPKRDATEQKQELKEIENFVNTNNEPTNCFTNIIIGKFDKIIPTKNQINFWEKITSPTIIEDGHYPFYRWNSWEELINYATSNK